MDPIDRRVIQIYLDVLANETNFNDLFKELSRKENIITSHLQSKFKKLQENRATNYSLNRELYQDIQTRGKSAFDALILSLRKIHPHLVELLLPNERIPASEYEREEISNENEPDCPEYQGSCTVTGKHQNKSEVLSAIKMLCHPIKARLILDGSTLTHANFHVGIKIEGKFEEDDIENIKSLYTNNLNLKIIMINIISGEVDNVVYLRPSKVIRGSLDSNPPPVFIVNIHIHKGDHTPSVIRIIKEVVSNNPGYEIRDIFRVVMEKLTKWGCKLNLESRKFPKFYF